MMSELIFQEEKPIFVYDLLYDEKLSLDFPYAKYDLFLIFFILFF